MMPAREPQPAPAIGPSRASGYAGNNVAWSLNPGEPSNVDGAGMPRENKCRLVAEHLANRRTWM
eukprot:15445455-Alexandrium_andersonii.AAC.1